MNSGPCYVGPVTVTQSAAFVLTRTGDTTEALDVVVASGLGPQSDAITVPAEVTATFEAGMATTFVARADGGQPRIFPATWTAEVLPSTDGSYLVEEPGTASIEGFTAGTATEVPCDLEDRVERLTLDVGESIPPVISFGRFRILTLVSGAFPPGIELDEADGPTGIPTVPGDYVATATECPFPDVGEPICAEVRYEFTVVPVVAPPLSTTTSSIAVGPTTTRAAQIADTGPRADAEQLGALGTVLVLGGAVLVGLSRRRIQ